MRFRPSLPLVIVLAACQEYTITPDKDEEVIDPPDSDPVVELGQPDIEVTPAELSFGGLPPDCPAEDQRITIKNVGESRLKVTAAELTGSGKSAFTLAETGPWNLDPEESVKIAVGFTPEDYLTYDRVQIEVSSNDPDEEIVKVPTTGEGSDATFREDIFGQGQPSSVDVLFIIDTSESMVDEQQALGQAIGTFVRSFVNLGLDYHLAITDTDVTATGLDGKFAGPWMYGGPSGGMADADVISTFRNQANLGTLGTFDETGFAATKRALTAPRINQAPNQGFLRTDATLSVVVISDEDDADALVGGTNPVTNTFTSWLKGLKANPDHVTFSGMTGPAQGSCGALAATPAPAYNKAIRDTRGVWSNICQFDINPFLTHLSFVAAGLEFRFELSETPASFSPSAITVTVDGVEVPYGILDGWTYDSSTNAIEVHGDAIPGPGASIVITYPVEAECAP